MTDRFMAVQTGLDRCLTKPPAAVRDAAKFGLLMNQASLNSQQSYACDLLARRFPNRLAAIFSPQHGLWCEEQDNMIETPHSVYELLGVPLYSLYSETRSPTAEMLAGLECLIIDLQDVGTRVYTFIWTVTHCLAACAAASIPVVILDRPNPLGGQVVEGTLLSPSFKSFVGLAELPMRHALTIGEVALYLNQSLNLGASVEVVPMQGWTRSMLWPETGLTWFPPSPNMPRFETALVYPGQVLLEGTNLSEGRGTTTPFEVSGAAYVRQHDLAEELAREATPGLRPIPIRFRPTFNKWGGQSCGGVALSIINRHQVRSYRTTLALLAAIHRLWPEAFALIPPPYEYELEKLPIDILTGDCQLSRKLTAGPLSSDDIEELSRTDEKGWWDLAGDARIYS